MSALPKFNTLSTARTTADPPRAALRLRCTTRDRALVVVSHELRQPLHIIQMNAGLLRRLPDSSVSGQLRDIAESIQCAIERQTRIIDDLLDVSRVRTGKLDLRCAEVDVGALVLRLADSLDATWHGGRILAKVQADSPVRCHADPIRLEQIVGNLLDNAVKFSPKGEDIVVRLRAEDGFARISVEDRGCGIAPEFLPHIFGLFNQGGAAADRSHGGFGIGLALVHGLTVAHGGFVKATSAGVDRGSEFNVWIPLQRPAVPCLGNEGSLARRCAGRDATLPSS